MLADRIRNTLQTHPHWGPKRVAEHLGTTARVISVTASREQIKFMDREAVEKYIDELLEE